MNRELLLDDVSVANNRRIENNLFQVKVDGVKVAYQGMLRDRVPPDPKDFVKLEPGKAHRVIVELTEDYPIPSGDHKVEVGFEHTNHFSPDDFLMWSPQISEQTFSGSGFQLSEKPPLPPSLKK